MVTSRMNRIRGRKDTATGLVYLFVALVLIIIMITWGVPWMARMAGLLITKDNGTGGVEELSPTPPIFSDIPEATNSAKVEVSGFAQPGLDVVLFLNGAEYQKDLTDDAGVFDFTNVEIKPGDNIIYAYAVTPKNLESEQSKQYNIVFDNVKPEIVLTSPTDGQVFRGQAQRIANFQGKVNEDGARVVVGERIAIVQSDGTFSLPYQLIEGDQEVSVKATDKAGNTGEMVVKLRWEP